MSDADICVALVTSVGSGAQKKLPTGTVLYFDVGGVAVQYVDQPLQSETVAFSIGHELTQATDTILGSEVLSKLGIYATTDKTISYVG